MTDAAAWVALLPLKPPGLRKTRLSATLDRQARDRLALAMALHVARTLAATPGVGQLLCLSPEPPGGALADIVQWRRDEGDDLNRALQGARAAVDGPVLVLHADLPLLGVADVSALIDAAGTGCALAPDRHERGTNAVALADGRPFAFAFGPDSFARHARAAPDCVVVRREGLGFDLDTPDDLAWLDQKRKGTGR